MMSTTRWLLTVPDVQSERLLWKDLPMLPISMDTRLNSRGTFYSPTASSASLTHRYTDPTTGQFPLIPERAQTWQRISMFAARCLGSEHMGPYAEAMDALRQALEEDLNELPGLAASELPAMSVIECRVLVACGWLSHGGRRLLEWARENHDCTDVPLDDTANYIEQGPLYQGPACMCLERWHFWLGRLDELAIEECGMNDTIRRAASEAARTMRAIEGSG
jgi:hypothetical protein